MHWRMKAFVQNTIAYLPSEMSYRTYYYMQKLFGGLRTADPSSRLTAGVKVVDYIQQQGRSVQGKTFFEVGTGRTLSLPIALWLCGAERVITVDLNPYLMSDLVCKNLDFIRNNKRQVMNLFGDYASQEIFCDRLERLLAHDGTMPALLRLLNIEYMAPADAARVRLPDNCVDYHVSFTVLEHIPPETIADIFVEGRRLLARDGLFVHCIDFTDHFSHSDRSISAVNFLQFNERDWHRYAGNRYMYQNRLRVDEFRVLVESSEVQILKLDVDVNTKSVSALTSGSLKLDARFQNKPPQVNAASNAWLLGAA